MSNKQNDPDPDPDTCEILATEFLFNIIRDTDISEKMDHKEMRKNFLNGKISTELLFDMAEENTADDDTKKDIQMYKQYALTCKFQEEEKK